MKILNSPRSALAVLLIAVILLVSLNVPAKADTTYPARELNLLLVYDESIDSFYLDECGMNDTTEHRLTQMARIFEIPFKETMNLTLNVTVMDYSTAFGSDEFSLQCTDIYDPNNSDPWKQNTECSHGTPQTFTSQHHTSAMHILNIANPYAMAATNDYDCVGVIVGHKLCYYYGEHRNCGGMAYSVGYASDAFSFVERGCDEADFSNVVSYQVANLLKTKGVLLHELSHVLGLSHYSSSPTSCYADEPCIMRSSFSGMIYTKNIWCSNCRVKINNDLSQRLDNN